MTLQVPYKIKLGLPLLPASNHLLHDCAESDHWEHRPRRGKAQCCWVQLGVAHKGGRQVSPLPHNRVILQTEACKPSTFNLQKLLLCPPALALCQHKSPRLQGWDLLSKTYTEKLWLSTPAQHSSIKMIYSPPLGRKPPTNRIPRRAAELSARKANLEKERWKGKVSLQALRNTKIWSCTAT